LGADHDQAPTSSTPSDRRPYAALLDLVASTVLADWLMCGEGWKARIVAATLDPFRGYLTALANQLAQIDTELTGVLGSECWPRRADNE
jgi:hypothetical protein